MARVNCWSAESANQIALRVGDVFLIAARPGLRLSSSGLRLLVGVIPLAGEFALIPVGIGLRATGWCLGRLNEQLFEQLMRVVDKDRADTADKKQHKDGKRRA